MFQSNHLIGFGSGGEAGPEFEFMTHTGGSEATDGDYKVVTFTSSGTFTPVVGFNETYGNVVDYLVIAGGGGGAGQHYSGGGGAGGYRTATSFNVTNTGLTVTVGGGGAGGVGTGANGVQGSNSVFSSITSIGGGFGSTIQQSSAIQTLSIIQAPSTTDRI